MNKRIVTFSILIILFTHFTNSAALEDRLERFDEMLIVLDNKMQDCSIDEELLKNSLVEMSSADGLRLTEDLSTVKRDAASLYIRIHGFQYNEACVVSMSFQVVAMVDIVLNRNRKTAAILDRPILLIESQGKINDLIIKMMKEAMEQVIEEWQSVNKV